MASKWLTESPDEREHVEILKQSVKAWNKWRDDKGYKKLDLSEENFRWEDGVDIHLFSGGESVSEDLSKAWLCQLDLKKANLSEVNLSKAKLFNTNLTDADLRLANLEEASLSEANLSDADLRFAYLEKAGLSRADLRRANLSGASLWKAKVEGANLSEANLRKAFLSDADLKGANLSKANLSDADLEGANLSKANLSTASLCAAKLKGADLRGADLSGADLSKADLSKATLVGTNFNEANLTDSRIYGISAWDLVLDKTTQTGLIITKEGDPAVTVNDIEVAQFIYFMLENKKIRRVINALTSKAVLILGRFTKKRKEILNALRDKLSEMDYLPIIFDFEKPTDRDFTETILTLACLSKFVIIDLTDPKCSPHEATLTIPNIKIPFLPIIQEGQREYAMFRDFKNYQWLCEGKTYKDKNDLIQNIKKLTDAAETKYLEIRDKKDNSSSGFTPL
jgi:uncharacterized protein YjbI with pentapeptide repeats